MLRQQSSHSEYCFELLRIDSILWWFFLFFHLINSLENKLKNDLKYFHFSVIVGQVMLPEGNINLSLV